MIALNFPAICSILFDKPSIEGEDEFIDDLSFEIFKDQVMSIYEDLTNDSIDEVRENAALVLAEVRDYWN